MKKVAVCEFCGQMVAGCNVPDCATEAEAVKIGTLHCNCSKAREYQMRKRCADNTKEKLDEILIVVDKNHNIRGVDETIIEYLKVGIDLLVENKAKDISVDLGNVGTIKLCVAPGKVVVRRSITLKEEA